MEGYTLVDGIVLVVILLSAVLAWSRGLVRECLSIAGWVIAAVVGYTFAPTFEPLIREVPVLKDLIGTNCELGILGGFALAFVLALVIVSIFTPIISGAIQNSALGPVDQGLGFLFGVLRGFVLIIVALVIYDQVMGADGGVAMVDNSRTLDILADLKASATESLPEDGPQWIISQFTNLTASCAE
ncbi:CvpA family protein [Amaricoccus tamworthensis]|uniref:CvpA family protein n=1 Tax=Amaricoccus tamworthensis TaxID=57002 RepID=UPI003C7D907E